MPCLQSFLALPGSQARPFLLSTLRSNIKVQLTARVKACSLVRSAPVITNSSRLPASFSSSPHRPAPPTKTRQPSEEYHCWIIEYSGFLSTWFLRRGGGGSVRLEGEKVCCCAPQPEPGRSQRPGQTSHSHGVQSQVGPPAQSVNIKPVCLNVVFRFSRVTKPPSLPPPRCLWRSSGSGWRRDPRAPVGRRGPGAGRGWQIK